MSQSGLGGWAIERRFLMSIAFSRYLQLPDVRRIQYRQIKGFFDAGRDDLVREWVWGAVAFC